MIYRLYFWIEGAPYWRPGGPWWYRDFEKESLRTEFFKGVRASLFSWAYDQGENLEVIGSDFRVIYPPDHVNRYYWEKGPYPGYAEYPEYWAAVTEPPENPPQEDIRYHEQMNKGKIYPVRGLLVKQLTWSDNTCSVGWTTVWGLFNAEDLEWLRSMHPRGWFTNTFYTQKSRGMGWIHYMKLRTGERRGFYFTFPEDEQGIALLAALRLQGMTERGKSRHE